MKKLLRFAAYGFALVAAATITGCSSDDEPFANFNDNAETVLSRSVEATTDYTITFEDYAANDVNLAGPTSYGANLYASYTGDDKFVAGSIMLTNENYLMFGLNEIDGAYNFWNGGVALSNWAIQNNRYAPSNSASDWWYSYNNQCSVYNTDATQTQKGAGAGGSDVFAILYGYQDSMNQSYMKCPELSFVEPVTLKSLEYCNSSYVYGVLENGNQFGDSIIVTVPQIKQDKGYFQVTMYCYDANDNLIAQRSKYLADYQDSHSEVVPVHTWTMWNFAEDGGVIGGVKTIKFNFDGSDKSAWGLNTPAYICLDNINVSF